MTNAQSTVRAAEPDRAEASRDGASRDELIARIAELEAREARLESELRAARGEAPGQPSRYGAERGGAAPGAEGGEPSSFLQLLVDAAGRVFRTHDAAASVHGIFPRLARVLALDGFLLYRVSAEEADVLELAGCAGLEDTDRDALRRIGFGEVVCGAVAADHSPRVLAGVQESRAPETALIRCVGVTDYACVPLLGAAGLLGTISFFRRNGAPFTACELSVLGSVSDLVAIGWERNLAEVALRQSETRFRQLVDLSPEATLICTREVVAYANPAALRVLGASAADAVVGRPLSDFAWKGARGRRLLDDLLAGDGDASELTEARWRRTDGRRLDVELASAPISWDGQDAVQIVVRDVTERREAEASVQQAKRTLEVALDAARMGVWELDLATLRTRTNLRHNQIFGYPDGVDEWGVQTLREHVVPEDRHLLVAALETAATTGEFDFTARILRRDGAVRWIHKRGRASFDHGGKAVRITGVTRDVTDQKEAERALRESEEQFRAMADAAPAMLWVTDERDRSIFLSRGWSEYTGQSTTEAMGMGWLAAVHPEDRESAARAFQEASRLRQPFSAEFRVRRKDGEYRWVLDRGHPRFDRTGAWEGYIGSVLDVHDRKLATEELLHAKRAAEAASEAKSQFLAVMSHELRTPLTGVIAYGEILESGVYGPVNVRQQEALARIQSNSWHLVSIIEEILTLSRAEAGRVEVRSELTDLGSVAGEVLGTVESAAEQRGLALVFRKPEEAPILTDAGKVRQILLNLLGNAIRYTEAGSIAVEVGHEGTQWLVVHVRDSGPGIEPEDQERIFEPFTQVNSSLTRTSGGTGLGLAISRKLARLLGGDILLDSAPGRGSTFTLRLPRAVG
jgi:PAS domain S-box-containing protein